MRLLASIKQRRDVQISKSPEKKLQRFFDETQPPLPVVDPFCPSPLKTKKSNVQSGLQMA